MALTDTIKGAFVRAALGKLKDGNHGSTLLGIIAAALLTGGLDFAKLMRGLQDEESATECAKALVIVLLAIWGWYIGRNKKPEAKG